MKFIFAYLPREGGADRTVQQQFALAREEFVPLGATVSLVEFDTHFVGPGVDSPYATRAFSEEAVVIEVATLDLLTRYVSDTGRTLNIMAASAWESACDGAEIFTHRLFVFVDGFADQDDA